MAYQPTSSRDRLTRLLDEIPDVWLDVLLPIVVRIAALVRSFYNPPAAGRRQDEPLNWKVDWPNFSGKPDV